MPKQAQLPDGTILEFPDETSGAVIDRAVKNHLKTSTREKENSANLAKRGDDNLDAFVRGAADASSFGTADEFAAKLGTATGVSGYKNSFGGVKGDYDQSLKEQRQLDAVDAKVNPVARTLGQLTGSIAAGFIAPQAIGGRLQSFKGALTTAAAQSGFYGFGSGEGGANERAGSAISGAIAGAGTAGLLRGAGSLIKGRVIDPAVKRLEEAGVNLTPGQFLGGQFKNIEDRLTSAPIVGGAINSARKTSIESFNLSTINKALSNIGQKLPEGIKAGQDAIAAIQRATSKKYDELVPKIGMSVDSKFKSDVEKTLNDAGRRLGPEAMGRFKKSISAAVERFRREGPAGQTVQRVQSELKEDIRKFSRGLGIDDRDVSRLLRQFDDNIFDSVQRATPAAAKELKALRRAYAMQAKIEDAAGKAKNSIFSPAQLEQSAKTGATRSQRARGAALLQQHARDARDILPSSVPDSGTAGRVALMALPYAGALSYAYGNSTDSTALKTIGALGLGASAYTPTGQRIVKSVLGSRPQSARTLGEFIRKSSSNVALPAAILAAQPATQP